MPQLTFTIEDFKSPERLERLFQRLNQALGQSPASASSQPDYQALVERLAPLIRSQLQASGSAPLNLQSLLPPMGLGTAVVLEDTHANRLTSYLPADYDVGAAFYETDRTVLYVVATVSGAKVWKFAAGSFTAARASYPSDLGTNDDGFLFYINNYAHLARWDGTAWRLVDGGGGYFVDSAIALGTGYQLCDGTVTDYISNNTTNLAVVSFTTPDENSGAAGVYHESIAAYTAAINAAVAPGISGNTANQTAVNQAQTATNQNTVVAAHAVVERSNVAGTGVFVFNVAADANHATHSHVQDSHNHTQDAHLHGAGTLVADATGEPRRMGVLRYFRR